MADVAPRSAARSSERRAGSLLCVANFPANTGYAWDFIESLYAGIANELSSNDIQTWVAYPEVAAPPRTLERSRARAVELDSSLKRLRCVIATLRFVRANSVRVLYMADRPAWHPVYLMFRAAGVRRIVVHDHTSGERTVPRGLKRALKLALRRIFSAMMADQVIGVSDYVAQRKVEVDLVPAARVRRVWNSLVVPERNPAAREQLRRAFGLNSSAPVIACACRASPPKGVEFLLRAFDRVEGDAGSANPVLVYFGDGPDLERLRSIRAGLRKCNQVVFAGYRSDARDLIEGADVCVVPSVWQEAFGLAALEPMARGVAVVATTVGGIPEVVVENETGLLVPPGDEAALAHALEKLLRDPELSRALGERGRRRALQHFAIEDQVRTLSALLKSGFALHS